MPIIVENGRSMIDTEQRDLELKKLAVQLTASMLDNSNAEFDEADTAKAFKVLYDAIKLA